MASSNIFPHCLNISGVERREGGREISAVSVPKEHIVSGIALAMGFALLASAISVYQADVKHYFKIQAYV